MKKEKITICLIAAVLFITAGQGFGWTQFNNGGTQDVNYQLNDDVWVDYYQASFMQTIVNLLKGGNIPSPYTLQGFNNSRINISGGTINYLQIYNSSQVTMSSGTVNDLQTNDSSRITISGGTIGGRFLLGISANSSAILIIHGSNFAIDGRPVSPGKIISIISIFGGGCENEPHRRLTGTLANGDIINSQVKIGYDAKIFLVRD